MFPPRIFLRSKNLPNPTVRRRRVSRSVTVMFSFYFTLHLQVLTADQVQKSRDLGVEDEVYFEAIVKHPDYEKGNSENYNITNIYSVIPLVYEKGTVILVWDYGYFFFFYLIFFNLGHRLCPSRSTQAI